MSQRPSFHRGKAPSALLIQHRRHLPIALPHGTNLRRANYSSTLRRRVPPRESRIAKLHQAVTNVTHSFPDGPLGCLRTRKRRLWGLATKCGQYYTTPSNY
jgi:hypothetical protein